MVVLTSELEELVHAKVQELMPEPRRVRVHVDGGLVTVYGDANADDADQLCAALRRMPAVDEVENRIRVYPGM